MEDFDPPKPKIHRLVENALIKRIKKEAPIESIHHNFQKNIVTPRKRVTQSREMVHVKASQAQPQPQPVASLQPTYKIFLKDEVIEEHILPDVMEDPYYEEIALPSSMYPSKVELNEMQDLVSDYVTLDPAVQRFLIFKTNIEGKREMNELIQNVLKLKDEELKAKDEEIRQLKLKEEQMQGHLDRQMLEIENLKFRLNKRKRLELGEEIEEEGDSEELGDSVDPEDGELYEATDVSLTTLAQDCSSVYDFEQSLSRNMPAYRKHLKQKKEKGVWPTADKALMAIFTRMRFRRFYTASRTKEGETLLHQLDFLPTDERNLQQRRGAYENVCVQVQDDRLAM